MARWRKVALGGGGCGCAALLAGAGTLALSAGAAVAAGLVVAARWEEGLRSALDQATGGEVTFSGVGLSWDGVVVRDVVVLAEDGEPCLGAERVRVGIGDLASLRTDTWALSSLDARGVRVHARRTPTGWALPRKTLAWLRADEAGGVALPAVRVPEVRVRDAVVVAELEQRPITLDLRDVRLGEVALTPSPDGPDLVFAGVTADAATLSAPGLVARARGLGASGRGATWTLDGGWRLRELSASGASLVAGGATADLDGLTAADLDVATLDAGPSRLERAVVRSGADRVVAERLAGDPGPLDRRLVVPELEVATVSAELTSWKLLSEALRGWAGIGGLPVRTAEIGSMRVGRLDLGRARLDRVTASGLALAEDRLRYRALEAEEARAGAVSARALVVRGAELRPGPGLSLPGVRAEGLTLAMDLHAPHLGLADLVGALPRGTSFGEVELTGTRLTVAAGERSVEGTVATLTARDLAATDEGWTAAAARASTVEAKLRSSSGTLTTSVDGVDLAALRLAPRATVASGALSGVAVRSGSAPVARADRVDLREDGTAVVSGGEAWTALVGPHALEVPPVLAEHVPKGLGGSAAAQGPWWDVALGDLPWVPARIRGQGTLHLEDRLLARKTWEVVAESFTLGPFGGSSAALAAEGRFAGGSFSASGTASSAGRIDLRARAKGLDAEAFEPYGGPLLASSGLGVGPGRIQLDLGADLGPERLHLGGDLAVRDLALVVEDQRRLGSMLLTTFSGGRYEVADRHVPVDVACRLADLSCSPIGELAAQVVEDLVDAATNGLSGGVKGVLGNRR